MAKEVSIPADQNHLWYTTAKDGGTLYILDADEFNFDNVPPRELAIIHSLVLLVDRKCREQETKRYGEPMIPSLGPVARRTLKKRDE